MNEAVIMGERVIGPPADAKKRLGDWEIDTVVGKNHKGARVTIVARKSKYTLIKRLAKKKADLAAKETVDLVSPFSKRVLTITSDNGQIENRPRKILGFKSPTEVFLGIKFKLAA